MFLCLEEFYICNIGTLFFIFLNLKDAWKKVKDIGMRTPMKKAKTHWICYICTGCELLIIGLLLY